MELMEGRIQLGSKAEAAIVLESKKMKFAAELLSEVEEDCGGRLSNLKRLTHLDLSGTSVSSLTLSHGLDCPDLRHLAASDCHGGLVSEQAGLNSLPKMRKFSVHNLYFSIHDKTIHPLYQGLVEAARRHRRLSHLGLASSCVTDLGLLDCVSGLPRLTSLDLRRCLGLTSGVLPHLAQLTSRLQVPC